MARAIALDAAINQHFWNGGKLSGLRDRDGTSVITTAIPEGLRLFWRNSTSASSSSQATLNCLHNLLVWQAFSELRKAFCVGGRALEVNAIPSADDVIIRLHAAVNQRVSSAGDNIANA